MKTLFLLRLCDIYLLFFMSQDNLIKLISLGDEKGKGKGHIIWSHKNMKKLRSIKIEIKKFNPVARKHTLYREKK